MDTDKQDQSKVFVAPRRRHDEVYEAYTRSDAHWEDCLTVVRTSPLRSVLFDMTEWVAKYCRKHSQVVVDRSFEHTIGAATSIIEQIVNDAVAIFDEWDNECGTDPQPDTVFEAYRDSDAIWDIYEIFINYSPINWLRSRILGWLGTTFPTTRIGEWATLLQADHYLVGLDALIKDILEHALDAFANSMEPADLQDYGGGVA